MYCTNKKKVICQNNIYPKYFINRKGKIIENKATYLTFEKHF